MERGLPGVDYNQADLFPFKQDCPIVVYNQVQSCLNGNKSVPIVVYNQADLFPFKQDCTNVDYNQADTFKFKQDCPM